MSEEERLFYVERMPVWLSRIRSILENATPETLPSVQRRINKSLAERKRYSEDPAYRDRKKAASRAQWAARKKAS